MQLKTLLSGALSALAIAAHACWFTADNFNGNYIAGVNNYVEHYSPASNIDYAVYYNGGAVDMPLTVYVKVGKRFADQEGETSGSKSIKKAVLQYKILPNGKWTTVKTLENLSWEMDFQYPVALFGKNNINLKGLPAGTELLIRLYLSDGTYETGDLETDITSTVPSVATHASGGEYEGGWTAPFVMRVKVSGNQRPVIRQKSPVSFSWINWREVLP